MQPTINIAGLSLKTFGLMFALGFIAAGLIIGRRLRELGKPVDWAYEIAFSAIAGGLVGSRAYWVVENYGQVKGDVLGNLFSGTGLVWYGGAIGGAICVLGWAYWRGMLNLGLCDLCAAPLAVGYAIGRIGCQLSGDGDYGRPWNGPWAMAYPHGTVPTTTPVHPTPIYETVTMGLVAWVLWRLRDTFRPGVLFALYLVLAGTERFLVEFIRRNHPGALGLTPPQWESIGMIVVGAVWMLVVARRHGTLRRPGAPAPATREPARAAAA